MTKSGRAVRTLVKLQKNAQRSRHVYLIRHDENAPAWAWELVGPAGESIATSSIFRTKGECFKSLRVIQRHAARAIINFDTK